VIIKKMYIPSQKSK